MIKIGELKERLSKFPDDYLVAVLEDSEGSMLAIYKSTNIEPELSFVSIIMVRDKRVEAGG